MMLRRATHDAGFTLVEALVALAICSFVMIALGNLVWLLAGQQQRLALDETDVEQAYALAGTVERLVGGIDPASLRLGPDGVSLTSNGLPQSAAVGRPMPVTLRVERSDEFKSIFMTVGDAGHAEAAFDGSRPQPLLSRVADLAIDVKVRGAWLSSFGGQAAMPERLRFRWRRPGGKVHMFTATIGRAPTAALCIRDPSDRNCRGNGS
jgi:type II secretory pathway pseudopilin PulG